MRSHGLRMSIFSTKFRIYEGIYSIIYWSKHFRTDLFSLFCKAIILWGLLLSVPNRPILPIFFLWEVLTAHT